MCRMKENREIANYIKGMVAVLVMLFSGCLYAHALTPAGTTADRATRVADTTMLSVQSGSNYIRIEPKNLPATVTYLPDTAFGPLPMALVTGDTLPAVVTFRYEECRMGWKWQLDKAEQAVIMEVKAHESASLSVEPLVCPDNTDTVAEVWDSIAWYGTIYTANGDYVLERSNVHGCEWTHTLHLTVHTTSYETVTDFQCDSIVYNGIKYTVSGEYKDTLFTDEGNRIITTLRLTIGHTNEAEVTVTAYEPYLSPQGKTYTENGDYTDTVSNVSGCDSVITTHLTMHTTTYDTVRMSGCDAIEYEGKTYTGSGDYTDTIVLASGDRLIKTLRLTVRYSTRSEETVFKNGSYTSPRGTTYTESGDYEEKIPNAAGCDSIIIIHLTLGEATYDTVYFCTGYNREHEEQVNELLIRRYLPYTYESPALLDYKEGVVKEMNADGVLVDLNRAEANLYAHYTGGLTPIETIAWSVRQAGESAYTPIVVESAPQWVALGSVAVQIRFLCGEIYTDALPIRYEGLENAQTEQQPIKRIENGNVVIIRGGVRYTLMGQRVRGKK